MSLQVTSRTVTLPPALNALAVVAQSSHDLLLEVENTKEIFQVQMLEKEKVNQEQAARIALLEAQVWQLEAANKNHLVVEQSLQGRVNELIQEKGVLIQEKGVLNWEVEHHKKWRAEYYDILCGLRVGSWASRRAALDKCRKYEI